MLIKKFIPKHQNGGNLSQTQSNLIEEGKTWLENWLSKRKGLLEENSMFDPNSNREQLSEQLRNLYQTQYEDTPTLDSNGLYMPRTANSERMISIKKWDPDTVVHEQTHALEPVPQVEAIRQLMSNGDYSPEEVKEFWRLMKESPEEIPEDVRETYGKYGEDYWNDPNEIYSRRNAALKRYGKDPNYKYNVWDLKNMIDILYDNDLDTYNDDFLLHLFNDVASNNKPTTMANMVKNGGTLKFQNAGRMPRVLPIEQVPTQADASYVRVAPVDAQFKHPTDKRSRQQRKQEQISEEVAKEILRQDALRQAQESGKIVDLPLKEEHPGLLLVPEMKMNGVLTGALRTVGGLTGGAAVSELSGSVGDKIDNATGSANYGTAGRILGSVLGYGVGSAATGLATNAVGDFGKWLNTEVPVDPIDLSFMYSPQAVVDQAKVWAPKNYQILLDRVKHSVGKLKYTLPKSKGGYAKGDYIGRGAESTVYHNALNPNTVVKVQENGVIVPRELRRQNITGTTVESAVDKGRFLADMKRRGSYTVPQEMVGVEQLPNGRYAPVFEQPLMARTINSKSELTVPEARRVLTTYASTNPRYADVHPGNMAFDKNGQVWLIDNIKYPVYSTEGNFSYIPSPRFTSIQVSTSPPKISVERLKGILNRMKIPNDDSFPGSLPSSEQVSSVRSVSFYPSNEIQ